jgi:hypothetical protein
MPHAFNQGEHPFGQCRHLTQVEPFEKPWFVIVVMVKKNLIYVSSFFPHLVYSKLNLCLY